MRVLLVALLLGASLTAALDIPAPAPANQLFAPLGDSLADIQATLELPAATWYTDRDGDKLFDNLEDLYFTHDVLPVIVTFVHDADVDETMAQVAAVAGGFEPRHVYRNLGGFNADLNLAQATAIANLDNVRQVEWSQPGAPELNTATYATGADAVQDLLGYTGDLDNVEHNFTGQDITIAIMDTGFHGEHVDLQGKFLKFIDWTDGGKEKAPYDSGNHGTHVASIAAGTGAGDPLYKGVAPGAALVGFQISGGDTKGNAIASMDWMIEHKDTYNIRISTISFGFGTTVDGTDALELATDKAWSEGIIPFKSTGNSGNEKGTVTIPGGARGILGIANLVDPGHNGFHLSSSSSRGPTADGRAKPDFAAPGSSIMAASAGTERDYVSLSGTSMASPHAAGIAALVLDADPSLTPAEVKSIFIATSHDWGEPGHDIDYGWGSLDALRAVQMAAVGRAIEEGWSHDMVASLNVTGPDNPWHQSLIVTGASATDTLVENVFTVDTAGQPFSATFIANGTDIGVPGVASARAIVVEVLGPGDQVVGTLALSPVSRQQTHSLPTGAPGDYSLRFLNLAGGEVMFLDVSAGFPPEPLTDLIPEPGAYTEALGGRATEDPAEETTPVPVVLALAALVGAAMRRRLA